LCAIFPANRSVFLRIMRGPAETARIAHDLPLLIISTAGHHVLHAAASCTLDGHRFRARGTSTVRMSMADRKAAESPILRIAPTTTATCNSCGFPRAISP